MRKIVTTLIAALLLAGTTLAAPISREKAQRAAVNFWNTYRPEKTSAVQTLTELSLPQHPHLHVLAAGADGFVIVAGDDNIRPILAYSFDSPFPESLHPELRYWLDGYEAQIREAVAYHYSSPANADQWHRLLTSTVPPTPLTLVDVPALMTTRWDQSDPYNKLCPIDPQRNERSVVGCVATAMAQILRYWEHPSCGTDYHSYMHHGYPDTNNSYGLISADFANTTYIWQFMPDVLLPYSPQNEVKAVSTISYHCGVAVDMMYGVSSQGGSGAYSSCGWWANACAERAFVDHFKYRPSVVYHDRHQYSDSAWIVMIDSNINAHCPLYYSGSDPSGGHAFVLDGADLESRYHFNWGWSGYGNGFYTIDNLAPGAGGAGGNATYTFNNSQGAIFNIIPDEEPFDTIDRYDTVCTGTRTFDIYDYSFRISGDTVLTAIHLDTLFYIHLTFTEKRTAYLDPNGGEGMKQPTIFCPAEGFVLPECSFTRAGHLFVGWSTTPDGGEAIYPVGHTVRIYSPRTFYAIWSDTTLHDPSLDIDSPLAADATVWPNPTTDMLNIEVGTGTAAEIVLVDALGRPVATTKTINGKAQIATKNIARGIYFVRICTSEGSYNHRIIKQ